MICNLDVVQVRHREVRVSPDPNFGQMHEGDIAAMAVRNITPNIEKKYVEAEVEEIRTLGLEQTVFHRWFGDPPIPLRWESGAGDQPSFSRNHWASAEVAGWRLFFHPGIVHGVVEMGAHAHDR